MVWLWLVFLLLGVAGLIVMAQLILLMLGLLIWISVTRL